jgi:hypothetical protein
MESTPAAPVKPVSIFASAVSRPSTRVVGFLRSNANGPKSSGRPTWRQVKETFFVIFFAHRIHVLLNMLNISEGLINPTVMLTNPVKFALLLMSALVCY